jgi:hypothetical protein
VGINSSFGRSLCPGRGRVFHSTRSPPNAAAANDIIDSTSSGGPYDADYAAAIGLQITGSGPGYVAAVYSGTAPGGSVEMSMYDSDYDTTPVGAEAPADDSEGSTPGLAEPPQIVASEGTAQGWSSDAETGNDTGMSGLVYDEDKQKNYITDDGTRVNTYSDGSWVQIDPDSGTILATGSSLAGAPAAMTYQTPTGTRVEVMPDGSWREYDQLGDRLLASGTSAEPAPDAAPEAPAPASPPGEQAGTPDNPDAGKLWSDPNGRMRGVRLYTPPNPDEDAGYLDAAGVAHGGNGTQGSAPAATSMISGTTISAAANPSAAPANDVGDTYDVTDDAKSPSYTAADITSRVVFSSRPAVGDIVIVDGAYVQITGVGAAPPGSNVSFVFTSANPTQNVALNQELANTPLSSGPEPDAGSDVSDWVRVLAGVTPFVSPPGGPGMPPPVEPPLVWTGPLGTGAGFGADGLGVATGGVAGGVGAATGAASGAVGGEVGGAVAAGAAVEGGLISTIAIALGGAASTVGTALGGAGSTIVAGLGSAAAGTAAGVAGGVLVVGALGSIILDRILHPGTFSEDDPSGVDEAQTGIASAARGVPQTEGPDDRPLELPPVAPPAPMVEPYDPAHAVTDPTNRDLTYPYGDPPPDVQQVTAPGQDGTVAEFGGRDLRPSEQATWERIQGGETSTDADGQPIDLLSRGLQVTADDAAEFDDNGQKTYDQMGDPRASQYWNEEEFTNAILEHVRSEIDYTILDMNGFTADQIDAVRAYIQSLPATLRAKLILLGF